MRHKVPCQSCCRHLRQEHLAWNRHCHTITFYFFFSSAAFLLCHTLSSVVTDFQISTRSRSGSGGSSAGGGAGQLADVFAGNVDKIFAGLTFLRLVSAMWLITQLWDATHHWCFAALLLAGALHSRSLWLGWTGKPGVSALPQQHAWTGLNFS